MSKRLCLGVLSSFKLLGMGMLAPESLLSDSHVVVYMLRNSGGSLTFQSVQECGKVLAGGEG